MARDLSNIQPEVHSRRRYYVVSEGTKPAKSKTVKRN